MKLLIGEQARADIAHWNRQDPTMARRIKALLENTLQTPFEGLGKPEPLKHGLQGKWSRRINREHHLIYQVREEAVIVISCRFHCEK